MATGVVAQGRLLCPASQPCYDAQLWTYRLHCTAWHTYRTYRTTVHYTTQLYTAFVEVPRPFNKQQGYAPHVLHGAPLLLASTQPGMMWQRLLNPPRLPIGPFREG